MGLFGFVGKITETAIKVASVPIALTADVIDVSLGNEAENTSKLLDSASDSASEIIDKLLD